MLKANHRLSRKKQGQSTVEYIILVAAVIAVLIVFLKPGGIFQKQFNQVLADSANQMNVMSNRLTQSRP